MPAPDLHQQVERDLVEFVAGFDRDPYGFVLAAFPWGDGPLKDKAPREWQADYLRSLGSRLSAGESAGDVLRDATSSGHGIGKSALVAWLIYWAMSTCADTRGVVTANTDNQLKQKTWAELAKWHQMAINRHWFTLTATAFYSSDPAHEKTWRIDAVPWSDSNTEAFAGLHNEGRRVLLVFDEASAISDKIWEVAEGALTDANTEIIWSVFGNPTRNVGRFAECFGRFRHRWNIRKIDSRKVDGTNKQQLQQWADDYGEDSDFVRVRVRGEFPRASANQFIPVDLVEDALAREILDQDLDDAPLVLGVDVARFGGCQTVFARRRGRKVYKLEKHRGLDTMQIAARVAEICNRERVTAVMVDGVGVGAGVVDRLKSLGFAVRDIVSGEKAEKPELYYNKRAEMWDRMREWLPYADLPAGDDDLRTDLTGIEYGFDAKMRLMLEKKEDLIKRGLASPDCGDAIALTFAYATPYVRQVSRSYEPEPLPSY